MVIERGLRRREIFGVMPRESNSPEEGAFVATVGAEGISSVTSSCSRPVKRFDVFLGPTGVAFADDACDRFLFSGLSDGAGAGGA